MTAAYRPHGAFVSAAADHGPVWRVVAGLALAEGAFRVAPILYAPVLGPRLDYAMTGTEPLGLFLSLLTHAAPALLLCVWMRRVHQRPARALFGPAGPDRADLRAATIGVLAVLLLIDLLPPWPDPRDFDLIRPLPGWLAALPFAALAILIQSGSEEVIFRGYIQQQAAARSTSRLAWMVLPSALFGALHFGNAEGAADGALWAFWAFCLGIACADLTARTGTLGAAIGLHFANNLMAFLLFGTRDGPDSGFALFLYPDFDGTADPPGWEALGSAWALHDAAVSVLFVLIMWLGARIALRR